MMHGGLLRTAAAAALRRRRASDAEHERPHKRHAWVPYRTAVPLSSTKETERRRRHESTAAATRDGGDTDELGFGAAGDND
jgi:hypothetical protein